MAASGRNPCWLVVMVTLQLVAGANYSSQTTFPWERWQLLWKCWKYNDKCLVVFKNFIYFLKFYFFFYNAASKYFVHVV